MSGADRSAGTDGEWCVPVRIEAEGIAAEVIPFGGSLTVVEVPDRVGTVDSVVLGFDDVTRYADHAANPHLGAMAGRYANRIGGGGFDLEGVRYDLAVNEGTTCLHGGPDGWGRRVWEVASVATDAVSLTLESLDGDQGFPGAVSVRVEYRVSASELLISAWFDSDRPTPVSVTNHGYWNLAGTRRASPDSRPAMTIDGHVLVLDAVEVLAVDAAKLPTGRTLPLADVLSGPVIGSAVLDHCVLLRGRSGVPAAVLCDPESGRTMTVTTSHPGLQVYTGDFLGEPFGRRTGVCLEAQHLPDAPNGPGVADVLVSPGAPVGGGPHWWVRHRFGRGSDRDTHSSGTSHDDIGVLN